ncbi:MAG: hypothetical protein LQ349_009577 [Xanthoria aureola]|nr:MAG: hypothetical protein LQ349_009577 [Xanthoria aureola]
MTIELGNGLNPESHLCLPGSRLTGHVVIRNPKLLSVEVIRVTIYGISDAYIHRSISGIRADFYGRGFLFQEIKNLTASPVTLEPNLEPGHRLPFEFTIPSNTTPMTENTKNFINKWQRNPSPALLGYTDSSISYRIDATCNKAKSGTSWLPQASMPLHFSPARSEHNPEPRLQTVKSQHQTKSAHAPTILLHIPSISYAGGPFPVMIACEGIPSTIPVILTSLEIRLEGIRLTRGRSFLFGEKECSKGQDISIIALKDFSINIGPAPINLMNAGFRSGIPQNAVPTFKSFTVPQMPYIVHTSYTVRIGDETVKGKAPDSQVEMLQGVVQVIASS